MSPIHFRKQSATFGATLDLNTGFQGGERLDFSGQIYCRLQGLSVPVAVGQVKKAALIRCLGDLVDARSWCLRVFRVPILYAPCMEYLYTYTIYFSQM